jgi:ABC-type amino acid transport substrate-binding protein
MKDPATGKLTGTFVETIEKIAENTGLKVQWTEEVGWGSQIEGLQAGRYDIVGSPVWANPTRGKITTLSKPVYYSGIGIYVRNNDHRFDKDWSTIDSDKTRISTIDGETGDLIARTQFPKAQRVSLPQLTDISQLFLEVAGGKGDVMFAEPYFAIQYAKNNPNALRNIAAEHPIKVLGNCYMFKTNEFQFKQLIDTALEDLQNSGYITQILSKYEGGSTFYEVAPPYKPKSGM